MDDTATTSLSTAKEMHGVPPEEDVEYGEGVVPPQSSDIPPEVPTSSETINEPNSDRGSVQSERWDRQCNYMEDGKRSCFCFGVILVVTGLFANVRGLRLAGGALIAFPFIFFFLLLPLYLLLTRCFCTSNYRFCLERLNRLYFP